MLALENELANDMDMEFSPLDGYGSEEEGLVNALGYRRLAAANALLRLARQHDSRLHVLPYYKLALTMQVEASIHPLAGHTFQDILYAFNDPSATLLELKRKVQKAFILLVNLGIYNLLISEGRKS